MIPVVGRPVTSLALGIIVLVKQVADGKPPVVARSAGAYPT
jgi:hypothetical protein